MFSEGAGVEIINNHFFFGFEKCNRIIPNDIGTHILNVRVPHSTVNCFIYISTAIMELNSFNVDCQCKLLLSILIQIKQTECLLL